MLFPDYRKPLRPRAGQCHGKLSKSEPAATTDQKYIHTGPELQTTLTSWEIPASGTTGIYDCFQEWPVTINDWNWISTKCICYNTPVSVSCKSRMIDQVLLESEKSSFTNIPHTTQEVSLLVCPYCGVCVSSLPFSHNLPRNLLTIVMLPTEGKLEWAPGARWWTGHSLAVGSARYNMIQISAGNGQSAVHRQWSGECGMRDNTHRRYSQSSKH